MKIWFSTWERGAKALLPGNCSDNYYVTVVLLETGLSLTARQVILLLDIISQNMSIRQSLWDHDKVREKNTGSYLISKHWQKQSHYVIHKTLSTPLPQLI